MGNIFDIIAKDELNSVVPAQEDSTVEKEVVVEPIRTISDDSLIVQLIGTSKSDFSKKLTSEVSTCAFNDVELSSYLIFRCLTSKSRALELAKDPRVKGKDEAARYKYYSLVFGKEMTTRTDIVNHIKQLISTNDKTASFLSGFVTKFLIK